MAGFDPFAYLPSGREGILINSFGNEAPEQGYVLLEENRSFVSLIVSPTTTIAVPKTDAREKTLDRVMETMKEYTGLKPVYDITERSRCGQPLVWRLPKEDQLYLARVN